MHELSNGYLKLKLSTLSENPNFTYRWCNSDTLLHEHNDFYEISLITQGTFSHVYNGMTEQLKQGDLFLFDIRQKHHLFPCSKDSIHFTICFSASYFDMLMHMFFFDYDIFSQKKYLSFHLPEPAFRHLFMIANNLQNDNSEFANIKLLFFNALTYLSSRISSVSQQKIDIVDDICEKMRNYSYLTMNIEEIYKQYPYSAPTIIKKFKQRTGMTPVQFQTSVRLEYAARLLRETTHSTEQIIHNLGFHSSSHFYELFKSHYHETPNAYRKKTMNLSKK